MLQTEILEIIRSVRDGDTERALRYAERFAANLEAEGNSKDAGRVRRAAFDKDAEGARPEACLGEMAPTVFRIGTAEAEAIVWNGVPRL